MSAAAAQTPREAIRVRDVQTAGIGDILVRGKWAPWLKAQSSTKSRSASGDSRKRISASVRGPYVPPPSLSVTAPFPSPRYTRRPGRASAD